MSDSRRPYPSDLSDAEWELLAPLLAPPGRCGRPRKWPIRHVADAIFCVLRSGCAWRMLCRASSRLGRRSITTSGSGIGSGPYAGHTTCCAARSGHGKGGMSSRARP